MPSVDLMSAGPAADAAPESPSLVPSELRRLFDAGTGPDAEEAWTAFVAAYSAVLLRVAWAFAPGYDGALDRYAYMLDRLRQQDCRRLRRFVADGRGRFSTWLTVVARRLCLDHYRRRYGRLHSHARLAPTVEARATRRRLADLAAEAAEVTSLADPASIDPVELMTSTEQREDLNRAVAELSAADQLLLRLRFEENLSARQVALLLGLPTPFHVYRRVDAVCGMLRARLVGSIAPLNNVRPATKGRKRRPACASRLTM